MDPQSALPIFTSYLLPLLSPAPTPTASARFATSLAAHLLPRLSSSWHPSSPLTGSAHRALTPRDPLLLRALADAGPFTLKHGEWVLWADPGCVSVREGRGRIRVLWGELPESVAAAAEEEEEEEEDEDEAWILSPSSASPPITIAPTSPRAPPPGPAFWTSPQRSRAIPIVRPTASSAIATQSSLALISLLNSSSHPAASAAPARNTPSPTPSTSSSHSWTSGSSSTTAPSSVSSSASSATRKQRTVLYEHGNVMVRGGGVMLGASAAASGAPPTSPKRSRGRRRRGQGSAGAGAGTRTPVPGMMF